MSKSKDKIRVSFKSSGAAEDVTGSCTVITWGKPERTILVDCGLIQGNQSLLKEYQANNARFSFKEKNVDYVFISHAHSDHTGRLSLLTKRGFNGKIIVPEGNKDIIRELSLDSAKIMLRDAEDLFRRFKKDYPPIYEESDVKNMVTLIKEYPFNEKIKLDDEVTFEFIPSGHIIGAAQLILYIKNGNVTRKIAFTGDLGNLKTESYYANKFEPIQNANLLIGECTYANRERSVKAKDREKDLEKIQAFVRDVCIDGNGRILFPSFSLMRSQVMITILYDLFKNDPEFNIPIYVGSPLTCKINKIFDNILTGKQLEKWQEVCTWDKLIFTSSFEDVETALSKNSPMLFVLSSGMLSGGFSPAVAEKLLPSSKDGIAFVGYSVEGTLAWKIKQKKTKTISINGKQIHSRCKVINLNSFSSHMQRDELCDYYSGGFGTGMYGKIVLQHGNMKDRLGLASDLQELISKRNRTDKVIIANKSTEILL
nr:MAG TPA: hypothetical protein [Caudoviricetes sp.]